MKHIQLVGESLLLENLFIQDCEVLETIDLQFQTQRPLSIDIRNCNNLKEYLYWSPMRCQLLRLEGRSGIDLLQKAANCRRSSWRILQSANYT